MPVDWLPVTHPALVFAVLFAVVLVAPLAAERLHMPGLIGLILAGVVIGPHALGLLEREGVIALLGDAGLLYLMFLAGLGLDLEGFAERRRDSAWLGAATFTLPMVVNTLVCLLLGFSLLASLLLASAVTSHTLVHYPLVRRLGLSRHRAVTATLGATLPANVGALLVLAVVAAAHRAAPGAWPWVAIAGALLLLGAVTVYLLPRLTRWFFTNLGQDRNTRLIYVLLAMFGVAALAQISGIEAIVGAFLAGLALNRYVPDGSVLMERINTLGNVLLVPVFLVSTGMLVDPVGLATSPGGLAVGLALTASALAAKALAAVAAGVPLGFGRQEIAVLFSLSGAQAAGAIAAAVVALNIGLVDQQAVNAIVVVMLGTLLVTALVAERAAPLIPRPGRRPGRLGDKLVVPVANPDSAQPLMRLASLLVSRENGEVIPVNIVPFEATPDEIDERRLLTDKAEQIALGYGAEATSMVRVDHSPTAGVLHSIVETHATGVLLGWKGFASMREHFFGGVIDTVLPRLPVPALVCRIGHEAVTRRVVLSLTRGDLGPAGVASRELALDVANRLARSSHAPLVALSEVEDPLLDTWLAAGRVHEVSIDPRRAAVAIGAHTRPGDVIIIAASPVQAALGHNAERVASAVPERTLIVAVPRPNP